MFVLCRTSNGGAKDFEYEKLADGRHVYDLVGDKLNALGKEYMGQYGYSSIGLVIGGTHIEEFEYEKLADGRHVYDLVGDKLNALGKEYMGQYGYSSIGLVIGGTHIEEATEIRAKYKDSFFLIPGYGAQGGKAEDIAQAVWSTPAAASCWPTKSSPALPLMRQPTTSV